MKILLTVPRSGSHLLGGQLLNYKMVVTFRKNVPRPSELPMTKGQIRNILSSFRDDGRYWLHLPYDKEYLAFLNKCEQVYLLLRDPRDIIVSMAHIVDRLPSIGLNYVGACGRTRLSDFPLSTRIDFLIDKSRPLFAWFEGYRVNLKGAKTFHYEDLILDPDKVYMQLEADGHGSLEELRARADFQYRHRYHFRRGVVGEWKEAFSLKQAARAEANLGDIIEAWTP